MACFSKKFLVIYLFQKLFEFPTKKKTCLTFNGNISEKNILFKLKFQNINQKHLI